ncbi:ComF family protein [Bacillus sp. B15-48]|uniref:ComF family protein n=1 Tax=Bacillus sp. B15-48 TaxID=1548601 RepID=UPI00193FD96A|nr:ComF family protein [Bacillus sp. B15-48]MBM4760877.1 ComF family protein [Bacillus sp. B15-48]
MNLFREQYCLICHQMLEPEVSWHSLFCRREEEVICLSCKNKLKPLDGELCRICYRILDNEYKMENICYDCIRWEESDEWGGLLTQNCSLYQYDDFLKELIARFKYRGDYVLASIFKQAITKKLKNESFDLFTPIPLSEERLYERGFNQAEALIVQAGQLATPMLTRIHTEKQSKKSRADRIHLPQVFKINRERKNLIQGKKILLVDDIYTTGSTLRHAAKVLNENGSKLVCSLTVAR